MSATVDASRVEAFLGQLIGDWKGLFASIMTVLGDRLGLFRALSSSGPATSAQLAEATGCHERYVREWGNGLVAAGYLQHDAAARTYALTPEAALVLADESTPMGLSGAYENLGAMLRELDAVSDAFRRGGGVPIGQFGEDLFRGTSRMSASWHDHLLVQQWIPLVPSLAERLEAGIGVLDVGCGRGRALIRLATEYPASRFVGIDVHPPNLDAARAAAAAAGVSDRVRFDAADAAAGLGGPHDLITTFDVVHDAADPEALLRAIRAAMAPDAEYLMLEINSGPDVESNVGPLGTMRYGLSLLYCMTTSLAAGGAGLGTCGMPEPVVRAMAAATGFSSVERPEIHNPFNTLYVLRP